MPHRQRDYEDDVDPDENLEDEDDDDEYDGSSNGSSRKRRRSDFIDDVAVEDDEEDEDDEDDYQSRERGGVRQKRSAASAFLDLEAIVDEDEEEEEEEGEDDFIDHAADLQDRDDSRRMHHRTMLPREEDQEDVEALERRIQARYARSSHSEYDEETTDVEQQALLPSVKDPKLWMVKCAIGHEREAVICLMQKYIDKGSDLQIRSAVALDHLKNYIYVEADKEAHVREACKGLRNIFLSRVMLVPIKEMTDVLSVDSKTIDICRDSWVRLKIGTYKGDLAKVVDVDNVRQRVTIKLIPRIDLEALATKMEGREVVKKKAFVPPPRLMNIEEARKMNIRVEHRRDPMTGDYFENIFGMLFKDGFLYKAVSMKSISTQNIQPTFDELEKFRHPDGGDNASGLSTLFANRKKGHFMKGDQVIVIKGDLKNLKGCVEKVDEENVHIRPKMDGLPNTLALNEKELCKYFEPGNHVKVVSGTHEGATGMVITIEGHVVIILSDTTKEHVRVFSDHVVESSEVTTGLTRIGAYELHDLILLDDMNFGLIIRVESEAFQILKGIPNRPEVGLVKLREIKCKIEKKSYAPDRSKNTISIKDVVKILDGPCKGKQGPVEHIFRGVLFIYDRHHLEHAGFICARSHSCVLIGGSRTNGDKNGGLFPSRLSDLRTPTRTMESSRPPRGPSFNNGVFFGGRGRDPLIGKTIKIRNGPHKGYRGRVVDIKGDMVRIELESRMKIVTVDRAVISDNVVVSARTFNTPHHATGSETPMHTSRTPMHSFMTPLRETGGMTPIYDSIKTPMRDVMRTPMRDVMRTPMHEGMRTPMHDGMRTPVHDDGMRTPVHDQHPWNPHTPSSPSRNNWEEGNQDSWTASPQYHPRSPPSRMYEAPTPGSGWTHNQSYNEASTPRDTGTSYGNPYTPSTPGEQSLTPSSMSYIPGTPGAQPMTPGAGAMDVMSPAIGGEGEGPVICPDFVVTVRRAATGEALTGVVHEVLPDGSCMVGVRSGEKREVVVAAGSEIEVVQPKKFDRIFIMGGAQRGETGRLIGVDNTDGIVKLDSTLDVTILDMSHLAKLGRRQ